MTCNICEYDFPFFNVEGFFSDIEEDYLDKTEEGIEFLKYTFEHYCSCTNECNEEKDIHYCEVDPTLNSDYKEDVKKFELILTKKG